MVNYRVKESYYMLIVIIHKMTAIFQIFLLIFNGINDQKNVFLAKLFSPFFIWFFVSPMFASCMCISFFLLHMHGIFWFYRSTLMRHPSSAKFQTRRTLFPFFLFSTSKTWPPHDSWNSATNRKRHKRLMRDLAFYWHLHFKSNQVNEPDQNLGLPSTFTNPLQRILINGPVNLYARYKKT